MIWRHVQGAIASLTSVCSYDRAGYGFSDPADRTSDARNAADDLHALLIAMRNKTPIVYVGHSIAALYGVMLYAEHPSDVSGFVFVDPGFPHRNQVETSFLGFDGRAKWFQAVKGKIDHQRNCLHMAEMSLIQLLTVSCADPRFYPDTLDQQLRGEVTREWTSQASIAAALSELENVSDLPGQNTVDDDELDRARLDFGDKPVVVLTRISADKITLKAHDRLASASTRGIHRMVPATNHYIQVEKPDAIVDAVGSVVNEIRSDVRLMRGARER